MPYVEGESLRARLDREKHLPVDDVVKLGVAIAGALAYAHDHGVIHRDLKPENVLLQHGEAVVADFGIALAVSNAGGSRVTQTGLSLGTPHYMSPEQATGDRAIDGRSDIYSLAAVLYEMLGGEPPHSGTTGQAIIAKLMTETPRPLGVLRRSVPAHVEAAIHRGLEKLPADRWSSARELADALRGARPVTVRSRPLRRSVTVILGAVAVLATAVAIVEGIRLRSAPAASPDVTLRFPFVTPDSERFMPTTPAIPFSISPDDRKVVYVGAGPTVPRLYVRGLDDMQSRALTGTDRPLSPTFSPDGKWIAMNIDDRIAKMPADGGPLATILALKGAQNAGLAWVDRDTIIASVGGMLEAVPADGEAPVVLSRPDSARGETLQWGPRVIDGRFIAYISLGASGMSTSRIAILDRKTGRATATPYFGTTAIGVVDRHLIWVMSTGSVMAAAVDASGRLGPARLVAEDVLVRPGGAAKASMSANGTLIYQRGVSVSQLVLVDQRGARTPLGVEPGAFSQPRLSPDGTRLAVSIARAGGSDVWVIDWKTKGLTKVTSGGGSNDHVSWSPDSKRILYRSIEPTGTRLKWIAAAGGEAPTELLPAGRDAYSAVMMHDGKTLIYRTGDQTSAFRDIFAVPMPGTGQPRAIARSPGSEMDPLPSPDDKWISYASDVSGHIEVYIRAADESGAPVQVSRNGGAEAVWSRDGHTLYYRSGRTLYAATLSGSPLSVVATRPLFDGSFLADAGYRYYDIAPDGKHFLMLESVDRQAETVVVYNWAAELRKVLR
jgi:serine/threonine-protein kinase